MEVNIIKQFLEHLNFFFKFAILIFLEKKRDTKVVFLVKKHRKKRFFEKLSFLKF
jgi:hypothetical protein